MNPDTIGTLSTAGVLAAVGARARAALSFFLSLLSIISDTPDIESFTFLESDNTIKKFRTIIIDYLKSATTILGSTLKYFVSILYYPACPSY